MSATGYHGPDRVLTVRELMEHGVGYDEALRRIDVGDAVYDRGQALKDAVEGVRERLCISLDGPRSGLVSPSSRPRKRKPC